MCDARFDAITPASKAGAAFAVDRSYFKIGSLSHDPAAEIHAHLVVCRPGWEIGRKQLRREVEDLKRPLGRLVSAEDAGDLGKRGWYSEAGFGKAGEEKAQWTVAPAWPLGLEPVQQEAAVPDRVGWIKAVAKPESGEAISLDPRAKKRSRPAGREPEQCAARGIVGDAAENPASMEQVGEDRDAQRMGIDRGPQEPDTELWAVSHFAEPYL
jgi:hypothetical protein